MRHDGAGVSDDASPPLAHSAAGEGPHAGQPQLYRDHMAGVARWAGQAAAAVDRFNATETPLEPSAIAAGDRHDLGKLDSENQAVLRRVGGPKQALPIDHVDAAVASLWADGSQWAALVAAAHHHPGLASLKQMGLRRTRRRRAAAAEAADADRSLVELRHWRLGQRKADDFGRREAIIAATDRDRPRLEAEHAAECGAGVPAVLPLETVSPRAVPRFSGLPTRLLLSCLVDADHADAASHGTGWVRPMPPPPRWDERIAALESYLADRRTEAIAANVPIDRVDARGDFYQQCVAAADEAAADDVAADEAAADANGSDGSGRPVAACEGPVGIGKTTAVVGYLLRMARRCGLRRLIVVAPYTAIIDQTVAALREALVLGGERPAEVVAAHHSRVEFEQPQLRDLAQLWTSPVIVTTAVQFFETLAASQPARLRKLHALPGSAIMIDESHAALPASLWPVAWDWISRLGSDWGCRIVMASGTLVRLWDLKEIRASPASAASVRTIAQPATDAAKATEAVRVRIRAIGSVLSPDELITRVEASPGPRLVILNTTQSAAAMADRLARRAGQAAADVTADLSGNAEALADGSDAAHSGPPRRWRSRVLHLSTLLCPNDRDRILNAVRARLRDGDADWTLVATSCIEAGVDVSFRTGFREAWSVASLLQTAGRISRGGEYDNATLNSFTLRPDSPFNGHPAAKHPAAVLDAMFEDGTLTQPFDPTAVATEAIRRELSRTTTDAAMGTLLDAERAGDFPAVAEGFRVIDGITTPVLVDAALIDALKRREPVDWSHIARGSVGLTEHNISRLGIEADPECRGLHICEDYDRDLLGLGRAILDQQSAVDLEPMIV